MRRLTLARRVAFLGLLAVAAVPLLIGLGASSADPVEMESLRQSVQSLRMENESYKAATGELADQISSLQSALTQLGDQAQLDPAAREALSKLPAVVRSRAAGGGGNLPMPAVSSASVSSGDSPDTTFGVLKNVLNVLENSLASVKSRVENQQALARATPSIWPIAGWLSSRFGQRSDPFDGDADFHPGLDIAADRGTPVHATADGTVEFAGYNGNYGNSVLVEHGYTISTRFGHLASVSVRRGQQIHRGDVIGYVGSTGHATGPHLHYEILLSGQPINPLRLLTRP